MVKIFDLAVKRVSKSKDAENWLDQVLDSLNMSLLITDPSQKDNPIVYANKRFYEMTGYKEEEVIGKNCRFLQGPETDKKTVTKIRKSIKEGKEFVVIIKNYKKNGTPFWNKLYIAPVKDNRGKIINFVGIQDDATPKLLKKFKT
tara:strand:- start:256 stop:690 length:435 start_codon:yes stop_codon:yes gene_type:complete